MSNPFAMPAGWEPTDPLDIERIELARACDRLCLLDQVAAIMDFPGVASFEQDMREAIYMRDHDSNPVFTVADVWKAIGNWVRILRTNREGIRS